jgi:hypothetical protein
MIVRAMMFPLVSGKVRQARGKRKSLQLAVRAGARVFRKLLPKTL